MEKQSYIKVEGVNIYASVFDTEQISVIRGSSFILKSAIDCIAEYYCEEIDPISTGASSGLFLVKEENQNSLNYLVDEITKFLSYSPYCFFTFIVVHATDSSFNSAKEKLIAKLRFQQMQALSLAPDRINPDSINNSSKFNPCAAQGNRCGTEKYSLPGNSWKNVGKISLSIKNRFKHGRDKRSDFYAKELDLPGEEKLKFTSDIQTLSECSEYTQLSGKIAVLYLDGNGFSGIQRKMVETINDQKSFDEIIQQFRKNFLIDLIDKLSPSDNITATYFPDAKTSSDNKIRFETLMWGGDEMLFVIPAWLGLDLLQLFYQSSADWNYNKEGLTHAGGLVFCNAKTPISKMRTLAQSLADAIKEEEYGREDNFFDYIVLESIDYPVEGSINNIFQSIYGDTSSFRRALKPSSKWFSSSRNEIREILSVIPKGQVYKIADSVLKNEGIEAGEKRLKSMIKPGDYEKLEILLSELFAPAVDVKVKSADDSNIKAWRWVHLIELWDYLAPVKK